MEFHFPVQPELRTASVPNCPNGGRKQFTFCARTMARATSTQRGFGHGRGGRNGLGQAPELYCAAPVELHTLSRKPSGKTASRHSLKVTLLLLMATATAVVAPMFFLGQASGHDFEFHLSSWLDVAGQWHQGTLYPRWCEWANWGFGEPRFIFYPPASWMAGAALGSVLPWRMAPGAYIWLCLVGGGLAMWKLARDWLPPGAALAAALFFAVNPYHLVLLYYRSDFAELLASALIPLLVGATVRLVERGWRSVPFFSCVFAAIWASNAPAGVIATYSAGMLLTVGIYLQQNLRRAAAAAAVVCGFGLAAFYIVPAAYEQRWVQIGQVLSENLRPDENFLFAHANDPEFVLFNWKVSAVALAVLLMTGIATVLAARRRSEYSRLWWMLVALGGASALLMFPVSNFIWRILPKLQFVQFPWRWLAPLGAAFAFMAGATIGCVRRPWVIWLAVIAALGGGAALIVPDAWWDSEDIPVLQAGIAADHGFDGTDEYAPIGCDRYRLPQTAQRVTPIDAETEMPLAVADAATVRVETSEWTGERRIFTSQAEKPVALSVRLADYPAWELRIDGQLAAAEPAPITGQIVVHFPPGEHRADLRFKHTWDRALGLAITVIVGLLLAVWTIWMRRNPAS